MGAVQDAEEHLREAWKLKNGQTDRYTARIIFLRAALAALRSEDDKLFLGQLKSLFACGIQPHPSRNFSVRDYLQQHVGADHFAVFNAVYGAINEPDGLAQLNAFFAWQAIEAVPLNTWWPNVGADRVIPRK